MKKYNRVMLGQGGRFSKQCRQENYIGAGFEIHYDLTSDLNGDWNAFKEKYVPIFLRDSSYKSRVAA